MTKVIQAVTVDVKCPFAFESRISWDTYTQAVTKQCGPTWQNVAPEYRRNLATFFILLIEI